MLGGDCSPKLDSNIILFIAFYTFHSGEGSPHKMCYMCQMNGCNTTEDVRAIQTFIICHKQFTLEVTKERNNNNNKKKLQTRQSK